MTIFAETALLPAGWAHQVRVQLADDGRIAAVRTHQDPESGDFRVPILLPSPVNVHSHAFQRAMAGMTEHRTPGIDDNFWTWRKLMFQFLEQLTPEHVEAIAALVQMEMLEAGYSTNVEFHYLHHQPLGTPYDNLAEMSERIAAATKRTGIGLTLLPVHYQFGGCDQRPLSAGQIRFGNDLARFQELHQLATEHVKALPSDCRMGVAPHSLRAVDADSLKELCQWAKGMPIHLHLAEQTAEVSEVQGFTGKRPVEWLLDHIDVDDSFCLIHCTQMLPHETQGLAKTGAVAGLCPITESNLGDGIFDGVNWLCENGKLAIGSDSNIRISLSEELRTLDYSQRLRDRSRAPFAGSTYSSGRWLYECILDGGAQAAGRESGLIRVGAFADLLALCNDNAVIMNATGDQILDRFIFAGDDSLVTDVWSAGRHVVKESRHIARDEIVTRYRQAIFELTSTS